MCGNAVKALPYQAPTVVQDETSSKWRGELKDKPCAMPVCLDLGCRPRRAGPAVRHCRDAQSDETCPSCAGGKSRTTRQLRSPAVGTFSTDSRPPLPRTASPSCARSCRRFDTLRRVAASRRSPRSVGKLAALRGKRGLSAGVDCKAAKRVLRRDESKGLPRRVWSRAAGPSFI